MRPKGWEGSVKTRVREPRESFGWWNIGMEKKCRLDVFVLKFEMRGGCDRMWMCMCIVHEGAKISKSF